MNKVEELETSLIEFEEEEDEFPESLSDQGGPKASSMSTSSSSNLDVSPLGRRPPSFMKVNGDTGLHAAKSSFDYNVVKCLDSMFDDTATDFAEEEKLKTFLRIRPLVLKQEKEAASGKSGRKKKPDKVLQIKDETTVIAYPTQKNFLSFMGDREHRKRTEFKFSKVFSENAGQSVVFDECVRPLIDNFLKGENCLIFSYGATNSGKTYTLQGNGSDYGIIPRALDAIFTRMQDKIYRSAEIRPYLYQNFHQISPRERECLMQKKAKLLEEGSFKRNKSGFYKPHSDLSICSRFSSFSLIGASPFDEMNYALFANTMLYSVWVSFAELYNERVYDLLETVYVGKDKRRKELKLLQDRNGFVYIKDLTEIQVLNDEEAYKLFLAGRKNLQFAATQMNQHSSRSHSFFTLRVVTIGIGDGLLPYPKGVHRHLTKFAFRMTFCDLAGMERVHQTENEGLRLKESGTINISLTVLLKVIRILREKQKNGNTMIETIPFRESKLTHIFKSYFTSSTHIRMIVNVNPDPSTAESTFQVLHNSAIAANVIAFRPMDVSENHGKSLVENPISYHSQSVSKPAVKPPKGEKGAGKKKVHFNSTVSSEEEDEVSGRTTSESSVASSPNSSCDSDPPTVVPKSKMLLERIKELEMENSYLKQFVAELLREKDKLREESVKLLADQNRLWRNRYEEIQLVQETLNNRRISLMARQIISPGSKCGRSNTPPVRDLEILTENSEEEDTELFQHESDKENRPPPSKAP